jgi:hypothetical protein
LANTAVTPKIPKVVVPRESGEWVSELSGQYAYGGSAGQNTLGTLGVGSKSLISPGPRFPPWSRFWENPGLNLGALPLAALLTSFGDSFVHELPVSDSRATDPPVSKQDLYRLADRCVLLHGLKG